MVSETLERLVQKDSYKIVIAHGEQRVYRHAAERLREEGFTVTERGLPDVADAISILDSVDFSDPRTSNRTRANQLHKTKGAVLDAAMLAVAQFAEELGEADTNLLLINTPDVKLYSFIKAGVHLAKRVGKKTPPKVGWPRVEEYTALSKHVAIGRALRLVTHDMDPFGATLRHQNCDRLGTIMPGYLQAVQALSGISNNDEREENYANLRQQMEANYADILLAKKMFFTPRRKPLYDELAFRVGNAYKIIFGADIPAPSPDAASAPSTTINVNTGNGSTGVNEDALSEMIAKLHARRYGKNIYDPTIAVLAQDGPQYRVYQVNTETSSAGDGRIHYNIVVNGDADPIPRRDHQQHIDLLLQLGCPCVMVVDDKQPNTLSQDEKINYACYQLGMARLDAQTKRNKHLH